MGRHAAGESFLRGFLRHADVDQFHLLNAGGSPQKELEGLVERIHPSDKPLTWYGRKGRSALGKVGCLYYPAPTLAVEAWTRRPFNPRLYSLCGVTHTTASHRAMDAIAELTLAPVEPWDAVICTSTAVRSSVEVELEAVREDLKARLGASRFPGPTLATIPLGVNCADFATGPDQRAAWRERLDIPQDAIVALYLGRFNPVAKMNPALMAMALEEAAKSTGKEIYWVVAGWSSTDEFTTRYHAQVQAFCPSVHYRAVDGRPTNTRFSVWAVADFFISFSDNVQETFGLTPIEAMASGLPCVVSDWDGYRDTVRHGVDGFRIATFAPRPSLGRDLAYNFANEWIQYEQYLAAAAQMTAIDLAGASKAIEALVTNPDLRARMSQSSARRAREVFDWSVIIPQYQALWGELAAIRQSAPGSTGPITDNPRRLDPFQLFASYPTEVLLPQSRLFVPAGQSWATIRARLEQPLGSAARWALPHIDEAERAFAFFSGRPRSCVADLLLEYPPQRHPFIERGLLWLVKFGGLTLIPTSEKMRL